MHPLDQPTPRDVENSFSLSSSRIKQETPLWPWKKWFIVVTIFLAIQVLFFSVLLDHQAISIRKPLISQENQMITPVSNESNPELLSFVESFDPRIYSYTHPRGISAFLWRTKSQTQYEPAPLQDRLLALSPGKEFFEQELSRLLHTSSDPEELRGSVYLENIKIREQSPRLPIERTTIKLQPETLALWKLPAIELPTLTHSGSLRDTVLEATLGADGRIFTATLMTSCGLASADEQAIQAVSGLALLPLNPTPSFNPAPPDTWSAPQSITLTVSWATTAALTTNVSAK